ncbi:MAG: flagellar M-ring protein FliF C-terminal domain-containing protein, partial [Alphaproteobacteria bacterium]
NNLPNNQSQAGAGTSSQSDRNRSEETTNFEITKEVINSVKETGNVRRLSVAVLVDGIYTKNEMGELVYAPRPAAELEKLEQLVKSAIGFDLKRGDDVQVINLQFAEAPQDVFEEDKLAWLKKDLNALIQTLVLGGVAALAVLLVIRPLVARAIESAEAARRDEEMEMASLAAPSVAAQLAGRGQIEEEEEEEPEEEMIKVERIEGKIKSSTYRKINNMIEKYPEESLQIIRQWINPVM